jgi:hypothetical protein
MIRFELTGSGVGDPAARPETLLRLAKQFGAIRPRVAYHYGWRNQPKTIRFSAADWPVADYIADQIRDNVFAAYMRKHKTSLCPMLRAYPVKEWG